MSFQWEKLSREVTHWPEVRLDQWFSKCGSLEQQWPQEFVRITKPDYRIRNLGGGPGQSV